MVATARGSPECPLDIAIQSGVLTIHGEKLGDERAEREPITVMERRYCSSSAFRRSARRSRLSGEYLLENRKLRSNPVNNCVRWRYGARRSCTFNAGSRLHVQRI